MTPVDVQSTFQSIVQRYRDLGLSVAQWARPPLPSAKVRECVGDLWVPELGEWYACHDGNENPSGLIGGADFQYGMQLVAARQAQLHQEMFRKWTGRVGFWLLMEDGGGDGLYLACNREGPRRVWHLSADGDWSCAYDSLEDLLSTTLAAANVLVSSDPHGLIEMDFVKFDALRRRLNPASERVLPEDVVVRNGIC